MLRAGAVLIFHRVGNLGMLRIVGYVQRNDLGIRNLRQQPFVRLTVDDNGDFLLFGRAAMEVLILFEMNGFRGARNDPILPISVTSR